ncbi:MAG: Carboxy-terminal-processing protease [Candidatus Kaiserbacteria bacterium GW2011_GWC2_52_8b]|uniref:Carboxy-terminal-processing protease n=1 Tax=Candidatus Kaiserbacteria bacterium GW2011_GWC2_52_8b TaxID=1618676 RepID=A0A0G1XM43_9BACT|nr:MAG: Carboxy-terminal-processing protease [Candidatus Kaiserbacteria bacterium GW2011_GWC2_52_8b]
MNPLFKEHHHKTLHVRIMVIAGIVLAVAGFFTGYIAAGKSAVLPIIGQEAQPPGVDFSPVWKAWHEIDDKFVPAAVATSTLIATSTEKIGEERVWGMIEGLAASLNDPYSFFLPPVESQQFNSDMSGSFEGVGMEIAVRDQILTIVSPLKGTPAYKAGLKSGDQILKINGTDTHGIDASAAVKLIRGPQGTNVTLTILRVGWSEPKDFKVMRDVIDVPTVTTTARPDGIFVIQVYTFTSNSPELFRGALREFVQSDDSKLILDLRGNPGGYLDAAVSMASWFLPSGAVVVTEDYAGHSSNIVHRSLGYDIFNKNLKMVILVDKGSASASEILADALRYYGVAKLVGVNTFGKGSVQELIEITPETSLKLTVARWLGPDGKQIPREGIVPDVKVEMSEKDVKEKLDPQLDKAVELVNK